MFTSWGGAKALTNKEKPGNPWIFQDCRGEGVSGFEDRESHQAQSASLLYQDSASVTVGSPFRKALRGRGRSGMALANFENERVCR